MTDSIIENALNVDVLEDDRKTFAIPVSQQEAEMFPKYQGEDDVIPFDELTD